MTRFIENPYEFPLGENSILLNGPTGQLEVLLNSPIHLTSDTVAVICHPHPLFDGTMHNKVVYTVAKAFKEAGIRTVRFNFRGVGNSPGKYGHGIGETEDLLAIIHWVQQVSPPAELWLAGFSFGSYVAARAAKISSVEQLISIAPPIQNFNFKELPPFECPWLVIQGDQDEVVSSEAVFAWLDSLTDTVNAPTVVRMQDSSHFFHGKLIELRQILIKYINCQLKN